MPARKVVLTGHQEHLIESLVQSGRYRNASEVMREGLRLIERREASDAAKLEALRSAAQVGIGAFEHGEFKTFPDGASMTAYLDGLSETIFAGDD